MCVLDIRRNWALCSKKISYLSPVYGHQSREVRQTVT